jgi:protein TonB
MTFQTKRIGPVGLILLIHAGFFYLLQSGLIKPPAVETAPKELVVSLITPEAPKPPPTPEPPKPRVEPKVVPVVKRAVTPPKPVVPVVNEPAPLQAPPPAEPTPAPVAVAPPAPPTPPAPPAPPQPATPAPPKTVTGVQYLRQPQPEYPALSRRTGESGKVMLRVLVNTEGRPERADIQTSSGYARLDEAARQAVMRAQFQPYREDGKALAVYVVVPINFSIQ